jgi:hypothetical protein
MSHAGIAYRCCHVLRQEQRLGDLHCALAGLLVVRHLQDFGLGIGQARLQPRLLVLAEQLLQLHRRDILSQRRAALGIGTDHGNIFTSTPAGPKVPP